MIDTAALFVFFPAATGAGGVGAEFHDPLGARLYSRLTLAMRMV
jgi:hypothetical protein